MRFALRYVVPVIGVLMFAQCAHKPDLGRIRSDSVTYFQTSYAQCRQAFRELVSDLRTRYPQAEHRTMPVPSAKFTDLTIDALYLPAEGAATLLVLSSGVHGVEGFVGSAVQQMFMNELLGTYHKRGVSVLLIHGVNPYGFRALRRVTENNVDLNRNHDVSQDLFGTENDGYEIVNGLLNPNKPVNTAVSDPLFPLRAVYNIAIHGMSNLRQGVLQGQYVHAHGLYFGGRDFEPQKGLLEPLLLEKFKQHSRVLMVDLHTGYGERGRLHLFPPVEKDPSRLAAMEQLFQDYEINHADSDDFYTTTGELVGYVGKLIAEDKLFVPMVFEYGTLDSQTTSGSINSIYNMILENQGFHHGYNSDAERVEVRRRFREMYYPSSPHWRSRVMDQSRDLLSLLAERLPELAQN